MKPNTDTLLVKFTTGQSRNNGKMEGGSEYRFTISRDVWIDLASKVFDRAVSEQIGEKECEAEGGEISAFLHSYGLKPDKLKEGQVNPFDRAVTESFDHPAKELWLAATKREPRTLTPEEKKARAAKSLASKQETWDAKHAALVAAGTPADVITLAIGTRPE